MTFAHCILPLVGLTSSPAAEAHTIESVRGSYVEARTASVFAGACHYGSEAVTAGRSALSAWRIEAGRFDGVDLAGVEVAVLVSSNANLANGAPRESVVYVDSALTPVRAQAAQRWLTQTRATLVGDVVAVRAVDLGVEVHGDRYSVRGGERFALDGALLADRACCKMPQQVWYSPLERLERSLVGHDESFRCDVPHLGLRWSRPDENAAFVGAFGASGIESAIASAR